MRIKFLHLFLLLSFIGSPVWGCRMLGVQALPGESLGYSNTAELNPYLLEELEAFRLQGGSGPWPYNNVDGWGLLCYATATDPITAQVTRSELEAFADINFYSASYALLNSDAVSVLLGHLRQSSSGARGIANPHPFHFIETTGQEYGFAHNGDLDKTTLRDLIGADWLSNHPPQTYGVGSWDGEGWHNVVDSELFFFWLIKNIQLQGDVHNGLVQALLILEDELPHQLKNFLFSDGIDLYAYRSSPAQDIHYFELNALEDGSAINHRAIMSTPPSSGSAADLPWLPLANHILLIFKADGGTEFEDITQAENRIPVLPDQPRPSATAYPNPFNGMTAIRLDHAEPGLYTLEIYALDGQPLFRGSADVGKSGNYEFFWDGSDLKRRSLSSAQYIYRIRGSGSQITGKLLYLK